MTIGKGRKIRPRTLPDLLKALDLDSVGEIVIHPEYYRQDALEAAQMLREMRSVIVALTRFAPVSETRLPPAELMLYGSRYKRQQEPE